MDSSIDITAIIQAILAGSFLLGLKIIRDSLTKINDNMTKTNDNLKKINGSVGKLKVWTEMHEKIDDERHDTVVGRMATIEKKIP